MSISYLPDHHEMTAITTVQLPPMHFSDKRSVALQIAAHLRKALHKYGQGCPTSLRIPSAMELAGFYHHSILDVLDGLFELKNQHYAYTMNGLDAEIILQGPFCHPKGRRKSVGESLGLELFGSREALPLTAPISGKAV